MRRSEEKRTVYKDLLKNSSMLTVGSGGEVGL